MISFPQFTSLYYFLRFEDPKMTILQLIWWTELHWYCEDPHEILSCPEIREKKNRFNHKLLLDNSIIHIFFAIVVPQI